MTNIENTLVNETELDPTELVDSALLQFGGTYWAIFNVYGRAEIGKKEGRKATKGGFNRSWGTFKMTVIKPEGGKTWENIAYGDELNEAYGEPVSALFGALSNDYDLSLDLLWEALDNFDGEMGQNNVPCQVRIKFMIPAEKGAIIRQDYSVKGEMTAQFKHKLMLLSEPIVLPMTDPRCHKAVNEEGIIYDTSNYMGSIPTKEAKTIDVLAKNVATTMAVKSRASRLMAEKAEEEAKKTAENKPAGLRDKVSKGAAQHFQGRQDLANLTKTPLGGVRGEFKPAVPQPQLPEDK